MKEKLGPQAGDLRGPLCEKHVAGGLSVARTCRRAHPVCRYLTIVKLSDFGAAGTRTPKTLLAVMRSV